MRRAATLLVFPLLVLAVGGCGDSGEATRTTFASTTATAAPTTSLATTGTSTTAPWDCRSAPVEERASWSPISLTLTPNPVSAGAIATLEVGVDPPAAEDTYMVGWGADWQCWDGSGWVSTHLLEQTPGDGGGSIVERSPGVTVTIPAIGYFAPFTFSVTIPDVPPGWYRISETIGVHNQGETIGYLAVEVVAGG